LEERGVGFLFGRARVPIVPAAVIFDLGIGDSLARPGPAAGRAAAEAASREVAEGSVGAGTGATVGKWTGPSSRVKGGVGTASRVSGELVVGALVVCNASGDVLDQHGATLAGSGAASGSVWAVGPGESTVLGVVATNARLDKAMTAHVARMASAGIARAVSPAHTLFDGDVMFAGATGVVDAQPSIVGALAAEAVSEATRRGVRAAKGLGGVPGLAD
jgi:L-aminopeptidase/D-esterase-like protein